MNVYITIFYIKPSGKTEITLKILVGINRTEIGTKTENNGQ